MFHFPAFPPRTLYIQMRVTPHDWCGVSPFGNPRITVRLPTPRGISQATTSFFGSWCQGIHPVPLQTSTTENKDARVHCAVLKQRPGPPPAPPPPPPTHPTQERTSSWSGGPTAPTTPTRPPAHASNPYRRDSPRKHPPQAAVPSGPNSVPHAHPVPTRSPFPPHKRRTRRPAGSRRAVVDVPPMSTTPHTHGAGMAPGQPTPKRTDQQDAP